MIRHVLISAALMAGSAQAGLRDCAYEDGHNLGMAHRDIGGGFVTYEQSFMTSATGERQHVLENCASGERLITVMVDYVGSGPDRIDDVRAAFDTLLRSSAGFTPADVRRHMREIDVDSNLSKWNNQSCACAAAYPKSRGNKKPFQTKP